MATTTSQYTLKDALRDYALTPAVPSETSGSIAAQLQPTQPGSLVNGGGTASGTTTGTAAQNPATGLADTSGIYSRYMGNVGQRDTASLAADLGMAPATPASSLSGGAAGAAGASALSGAATGAEDTTTPAATGYYYGGRSTQEAAEPAYTAPILPSATSQEEYIREMYAANQRAQEENLRAAYEQNLASMDYQAQQLPASYQEAERRAAAQAAINQANFNEQAAASGLNTGAGSQVRLSQNNALLGSVAEIRKAQADAEAELNLQRTQLEAQYRSAINEAIANNDLQMAQALYQEAKRVDESLVSTAVNQANIDWTVWNTLYNRK